MHGRDEDDMRHSGAQDDADLSGADFERQSQQSGDGGLAYLWW